MTLEPPHLYLFSTSQLLAQHPGNSTSGPRRFSQRIQQTQFRKNFGDFMAEKDHVEKPSAPCGNFFQELTLEILDGSHKKWLIMVSIMVNYDS